MAVPVTVCLTGGRRRGDKRRPRTRADGAGIRQLSVAAAIEQSSACEDSHVSEEYTHCQNWHLTLDRQVVGRAADDVLEAVGVQVVLAVTRSMASPHIDML